MPHFSSANAAGTTSELIRLWRSRLKASPAKHHDNPLPPPPPPPPLPPPLQLTEGVLSQQSKMSEAQDSSRVLERRQSSDTGITRQKSEINEENTEQRDTPSTPKSESQQQQQHEKTELPATLASAQQQQQQQQQRQQPQQQQQQQRTSVGECNNLLPVLVERLRSALELSCSASPSCSEDNNQLPSLEDSGVDSEEDLRLWTTLNEQQQQQQQQQQQLQQQTTSHKPKLDLKFLEDILLADIHTALARLQDTLKRVDVNTLTRYNASLDSSNKLYLLRLISNLLAKLKVPEEVKQQTSSSEAESSSSSSFRRRKNDRHTIGVSADEIARARLWLDDSSCESSPKIVLENNHVDTTERIVEGAPSSKEQTSQQQHLDSATSMNNNNSTFNDKCMKDAINQQQSLQNKKDNVARRFDSLCKDDIALNENKERRSSVFYPRHNKFTAKKSKLKRANTIDIPNYLQLKSDSPEQIQNGCYALRRPIDVSDRISVNGTKKVVPLFEPKTDNDRKFLALINKNNSNNTDSNANNAGGPFKSFTYRNPASVADKNWQNRFSSIKTNFDKQSLDSDTETAQPKRKTGIVDVRKKFETPREDAAGMVLRAVPYAPVKQQQNSFSHAPTSPFQKIEKSVCPTKMESLPQPAFLKPGYAPKQSALQAKLKMFDQEAKNKPAEPLKKIAHATTAPTSQQPPAPPPPPPSSSSSAQQQPPLENGHLNYYSFCKQFAPFASGKQDGKSSVDATKNKLLTNLAKEPDKMTAMRKDKAKEANKGFLAKQDSVDNRYDFSKQYSYHKPYDAYAENYRQLDKKPQFNHPAGLYNQAPSTQSNDYLKATQNVAVQTSNESSDRRASEPELINSIADYPVPMPRKLRNNVSVQTTSPSVNASAIYSSNSKSPNAISPIPPTAQTASSPSIISPIPYPQPTYKPTYEQPSNYYNPIYLSDQNYYTTDNSQYPSYHHQQAIITEAQAPPIRPIINDTQPLHRPILNDSHRPIETQSSTHLPISQKLYNEFSKLPDPQPSRDYIPADYNKTDAMPFVPYEDKVDTFKPIINVYEEKPLSDVAEEHIENQELSSDGIVTRYTSAIATVSSMPESPEPTTYDPVVPRIKEAQPRHFAETTTIPVPTITERKTTTPVDEIQRHNMLQQSLIRRLQNEQQQQQQQQQHVLDKIPTRRFSQEIPRKENLSPSPTQIGRVCALKALNESHKAQEKIHMFEEKKLNSKQVFRPVNVPSKLNPPAPVIQNERSPIRSPIDSSDEYLMSCASKPTRNIVLSKSESWHQLALASKGGLQVPQATQQKPPKPKSPMRFTKQYEASAANDNMRKMEEKVQQYFQSSGGQTETKQTKSKSRRHLQSKKSSNSLMRSHTMPHLYDDRLFDDTVDVDQAFDSIFKEATRTDNRL